MPGKTAQGRGKHMGKRKQKGFSLIELLIVVAIILIIAAIAIPNLLRARMSAHEASAVASLRAINSAQISYNSAYPNVGYATTLAELGGTACAPPTTAGACLIDSQLASGTKSGYIFTMSGATSTPNAAYQIRADPQVPNQTGIRYFCSFADGVIRVGSASLTTCDPSASPLQ
jgi:prepilin-type N-terminal cleavage/methylation domain-containing protein